MASSSDAAPRAALVLYGRVGTYLVRTQSLKMGQHGDPELWARAAASIKQHVVDPWRRAGGVDVFVQSWNPELTAQMREFWQPAAVDHAEQVDDGSMIPRHCPVRLRYCERTMWALLGMKRGLALRARYAAQRGGADPHATVLVMRHDVQWFNPLPPLRTDGHVKLWLAFDCKMTACAAAQAVLPVYNVLLLCRLVAGGVSQTVWSFGLALAASLGPVAGIKATAWCMAGNSLGEVLGPLFGSTLFGMGGVRRPYTVAAAVAAAIAGALVAGAAAAPPEPPAAAAEDAAGEPASAGLGALADAPTVLLSTVLALGCGLQRAALDLLMPFSLRRAFGATPGVIGRASGVAALCFVVGSTVAGRALSARPEGALRWIALASVASSVATASMLLPGRQMLVCALFAAFYAASAVLGVAATTAIEERGAEIGNAQSAMAVSVFFWTIGFASGGLLASFALAGASSAARAQAVLAALGAANVAVALAVVARLRGKA